MKKINSLEKLNLRKNNIILSALLLIGILWYLTSIYSFEKFGYTISGNLISNYIESETGNSYELNEEFGIYTLYHGNEESSKIVIENQNFKKGDYTLKLLYSSSSENDSIYIYSNQILNSNNKAGIDFINTKLDENQSEIIVSFNLPEDVMDLSIIINIESEEFVFSRLEVNSNNVIFYDNYLFLLGFAIIYIVFAFIYFKKKPFKNSDLFFSSPLNAKREWFAFAITFIAIAYFTSIPILTEPMPIGVDFNYHISRIVGLESALFSGQFPARVHGELLNGYGYPNGIFYPELLLYPLALLYHFNISLAVIYQFFIFFIQLFTLVIAFIFFTKLLKSKYAGFLVSIIYLTAPYRLSAVFSVGAIGEITAMMFIPILIYGVYETIFGEKENWVYLFVGMSLLIQTHLLTAAMMVLVCCFIALFGIKKIFLEEKRIVPLLRASVLTILVNLWFILPMLFTSTLQSFAVFDKFYYVSGALSFVELIQESTVNRLNTGIGYVFLMGLFLFVIHFILNIPKKDKITKIGIFSFFTGLTFLLSTTKYFPWGLVHKIPFTSSFFSAFQGTFRFMLFGTVFLSIMCGVLFILLTKRVDNKKCVTMILSVLILFVSMNSFEEKEDYSSTMYTSKFLVTAPTATSLSVGQAEYILNGTSIATMMNTTSIISENEDFEITNVVKDGTNLSFDYKIDETKTAQKVLIPFNYYPGYSATVNSNEVSVEIIGNNQIGIELPVGEGEVEVFYDSLTIFRLSEIISLLSLLWVISVYFNNKRKNRL